MELKSLNLGILDLAFNEISTKLWTCDVLLLSISRKLSAKTEEFCCGQNIAWNCQTASAFHMHEMQYILH